MEDESSQVGRELINLTGQATTHSIWSLTANERPNGMALTTKEEYGAEENVKMGRGAVVIGGSHNSDRSAMQEQLLPRHHSDCDRDDNNNDSASVTMKIPADVVKALWVDISSL